MTTLQEWELGFYNKVVNVETLFCLPLSFPCSLVVIPVLWLSFPKGNLRLFLLFPTFYTTLNPLQT